MSNCRTQICFVAAICILLKLVWTPSQDCYGQDRSDVVYCSTPDGEQKLDLYGLDADVRRPLVVWIHGGAWRRGTKESVPIRELADYGYVIASVDYRLSPVAAFPAQVIDIRHAIDFLQTKSDEFGYDAERIAIAGASAGGHLAALAGVSQLVEFPGDSSSHLTNRPIKGIVSFYGASNLETILTQSTPHGLSVRVPALELLLGGQLSDRVELARAASPVHHVDVSDPPLLLIHGDQDPQMPINQAHELHGRYKQVGAPAEFEVVYGAAHGGKGFYTKAMLERVERFLQTCWQR